MTRERLKQLFPNASEAVLALSAEDPRQAPKLERAPRDAALEPPQAQIPDSGRFLVRVTSIRARLLDPDNLAEKYHIDCLRYAGLLREDSAAEIEVETRQRKKAKGEEEHTLIEVFAL